MGLGRLLLVKTAGVVLGLLALIAVVPAVPATAHATAGRAAVIQATGGQSTTGTARYWHALAARGGTWSVPPDRITYQWLRNGRPVKGATGRRYAIRVEDVGKRVRVRITAHKRGHSSAAVVTAARVVRHRVDVRRTVRYRIETRGRITASMREFRRQVQETFDDPRGWRASGIRFVRVTRGGSMSVVLAEANRVPAFSSVCSSQWSCRVGRYVIINQLRWRTASPAWNAAGGGLRGYRHMVVNHETGHFLGLRHAFCSGRGRPAPVMQQQSKGLHGCRFNAWPTRLEILSRTPR